jgi:hypothetical protein
VKRSGFDYALRITKSVSPDFADVFVGHEASERLEPPGVVVCSIKYVR